MRTPICISRDAACNIRRSSTTSSTEASSGGAGDSEQQLLAEGEIWQLCAGAKAVFLRQPNLLELDAPINVRGDMHGQFRDLIRILQELGAERVRGRRGTQHRRSKRRSSRPRRQSRPRRRRPCPAAVELSPTAEPTPAAAAEPAPGGRRDEAASFRSSSHTRQNRKKKKNEPYSHTQW
ncbi:hypothetical protein SEVIR_5G123351v4 [Setaria viridis]